MPTWFEIDHENSAAFLELAGFGIEKQCHGVALAVETRIGERYRSIGSDGIEKGAATPAFKPTHFKNVGEIRLEAQLQWKRNRLVGKTADEDALVTYPLPQEFGAAYMNGVMT